MDCNAIVVFIGGFLMPDNWIFHTPCEDIRVINVYPSPVGSLHDRAVEIFHELKGGRVNYVGIDFCCNNCLI
jgi:hypothetical protein